MKNKSLDLHTFKITIKNDLRYIYPVQAAARAYAENIGFEKKESYHIELLLEEILSNTIKYDFMPGQTEEINICFDITTLGLSVTIHSNSIPMDIEKIKSFENIDKQEVINHNASGLGALLINSLAHNVSYTNKGREGQFIRFEKHLPREAVVKDNNLKPSNDELIVHTDFDFYVRRLKPEEALFISQLAYYAYHVSYIYDKIYYPEIVQKLNEQGEMISVVGVNKENEDIIGHTAAVKEELSGLYEMSVAFVNPQYRGGGCLKRNSVFLMDLLKEKNAEGIFVHAVTTHPYSQKAAYKLNLRSTALFLSRLTPLLMTEIKDEDQGRESLLRMHLLIKPPEAKTIYAPQHHAEMIARIYENVGKPVTIISDDPGDNEENEMAVIEVSADSYNCSHIQLKQYGKNTKALIEKTLRSVCVNRVESIYLYLPMEDPLTLKYCGEFESLQFFFGGIVLKKDNQDVLMLQYLNNQIFDYTTVHLFSDFSNELCSYIQNHDPGEQTST